MLAQRTEVPGVGSLSKEARLSVALNSGTATGLDRLLSDPSRKWNATQHRAILDTLDARDWQFVKDTWTEINRFRDQIGAKQLRVTGVEPEWVEGIPVQTKFGEVQGQYYPLKYDGRLAPKAVQLDLINEAKLQMGAAYVATTTCSADFTVKRGSRTSASPCAWTLGVGYQHLGQGDSRPDSSPKMLIDSDAAPARDHSVSKAIYETKGPNVYKQFTDAFQDIATGLAGPTDVLQRSANFLRSGLQIANMGVSLSIAAKHPLGIFNGAALLGPEWMAKGVARWAGDASHLENTLDWIKSNSPMMRDRVHTETTDLSDLSSGLKQAGGWFDTAVRAISADHLTQQTIRDGLVWHIGLAQRAADVPTWLGGYEKAMDAMRREGGDVDETRAFRLADQAVLDSQGGGNLIDRAAVQRGNAYARLFMTFYSYGARVFNSTVEATQRTNFRSPASVIKYLGNLSLLYIMPALANEAIRQASGTVKNDEDATWNFIKDVGKDALGSALNGLVGVRELACTASRTSRPAIRSGTTPGRPACSTSRTSRGRCSKHNVLSSRAKWTNRSRTRWMMCSARSSRIPRHKSTRRSPAGKPCATAGRRTPASWRSGHPHRRRVDTSPLCAADRLDAQPHDRRQRDRRRNLGRGRPRTPKSLQSLHGVRGGHSVPRSATRRYRGRRGRTLARAEGPRRGGALS